MAKNDLVAWQWLPLMAIEVHCHQMDWASAPLSVTEVQDNDKEGLQVSLLHLNEKSFLSSLHSFMKERGTPIERIPHLGFKQIDLWMIFKAVEKLGGYNSVTTRRLWKKVYDELGGSPGSTSAATCTRRHYERLVLPYERHLKGENDKPLPLSKPRKPYKRTSEGKMNKAEWKGKRSKSEKDSERLLSGADIQIEAAMLPGSALWSSTTDRQQPQGPTAPDLYAYSHMLHSPAVTPWPVKISSAVGEVISPLEKKKRVAQASLRGSSQVKERDRPSVIRRSVSPASGSHKCDSSESSPRPLSSCSISSRSASPASISSEDDNNSELNSDLTTNCFNQNGNTPMREISKEQAVEYKNRDQVNLLDANRKPKVACKDLTHPVHSSTKFKSDCVPTSSSGFVKVPTKSAQLLRPAPIRPGHRIQYLTHNSKSFKDPPSHPSPWETLRSLPAKFPPTQQRPSHEQSYNLSGRDSHLRSMSQQQVLLPRMRIPQSQLTYHHFPFSTVHSALVYPNPYSVPMWGPAYTIPTVSTFYTPDKL
nr:AT-rich interactive domain-containing protein 5A-like [Nerophis lumbriciformis]